jgi:hypothetical protein
LRSGSPASWNTSVANSIHTSADVKKTLGTGKKERNTARLLGAMNVSSNGGIWVKARTAH